MLRSESPRPATDRRTAYVVKVYPRFSETFIVTEILAREAAGEQLEVFALRPTTDTRFHPEIARVQAPVHMIAKPYKVADAWALYARATAAIPEFPQRFAELLPELADYEAPDVHQAIALACEVAERGITHLHAHFASLSGRTAGIAALLAGIEYSVTAHAKDLFHESVDPERLGRTIRRAHHFVTISQYNLEHLTREYPQDAHRVHLVYNGLELDRFPYTAPAPLTVTADRPLRIAAVGRMVEKKGFPDLVEAARRLRADGVPLEVRIAGEGELRESLTHTVAEAGLTGVVALPGPQTQEEIRGLLRWADVFAAPSVVGEDGNADGLPTVLLEAMASGVPCVASSVTGIPEAIVEGRTGLLHAPGDVAGLVEALRTVASPDFDRTGVAQEARRLIETRFGSHRQARALAALEDGRPVPGSRDLAGRRVAYVCVDPGVPVFGTKGASVHVQEVVRELESRGARVTLFAARVGDDRPADLAGTELVHVPVRADGDDPAARERAQATVSARIAEAVTDGGFDLVYERYSLFSTVLAQAEQAGIPGILEVNAPLIDEQRTHRVLVDEEGARACLVRQAGAAARTIAVSEPVADWVRGLAPGADVRVVPNGVDTDRIVPGAHETDRARPRVVFVGTLKPWHGVEHLIGAVSAASADWDLVVVGDGPQRDSLQTTVAEAGLGSRVAFTGAVAPGEVGPLLAGADLAVAPYPEVPEEQSYFSPLKVFEYLAAGLPVVASAIGQIPRILEGTGAGVLVPPSDPQALAEAIDGLVSDPAARRRMSRAARDRAVQAHSWTAAVDAILADLTLGSPQTPARAAA